MTYKLYQGTVVDLDGGLFIRVDTPKVPAKGVSAGDMCSVRAKDFDHGKVAEFSAAMLRDGKTWGFILPKKFGIRSGETVMMRCTRIEVEKWFEDDTSTPLYKEAERWRTSP